MIVATVLGLTIFWSASANIALLGFAPERGSWELVLMIICLGSFASACGSILHISVMSALADIADEHELNTGIRQEGVFSYRASEGQFRAESQRQWFDAEGLRAGIVVSRGRCRRNC